MNPQVTEVSLETNSLGGDGVQALADVLKDSVSVTRVFLANQRQPIPTPAIEAMVQAVTDNKVTTVRRRSDRTTCGAVSLVVRADFDLLTSCITDMYN